MRAVGILGAALSVGGIYRTASPMLDCIIEKFSQNDPLSAMEEILHEFTDGIFLCRSGGEPDAETINVYPSYSSATEKICPKFLGIVRGMELLPDALEAINQWTERANIELPNVDKCAVLLTDKWDGAEFESYEQHFRYLAMNRNFWFILLLATKHGCTEIPFLPLELYRFTRQPPENTGRRKSK